MKNLNSEPSHLVSFQNPFLIDWTGTDDNDCIFHEFCMFKQNDKVQCFIDQLCRFLFLCVCSLVIYLITPWGRLSPAMHLLKGEGQSHGREWDKEEEIIMNTRSIQVSIG